MLHVWLMLWIFAFDVVTKTCETANACIASLKSLLSKNAHRRSTFPVSFPPWPVVSRWRTWLKCGIYLSINWDKTYEWVDGLENEGIIVSEAKCAFPQLSAQEELLWK